MRKLAARAIMVFLGLLVLSMWPAAFLWSLIVHFAVDGRITYRGVMEFCAGAVAQLRAVCDAWLAAWRDPLGESQE